MGTGRVLLDKLPQELFKTFKPKILPLFNKKKLKMKSHGLNNKDCIFLNVSKSCLALKKFKILKGSCKILNPG